MNTSRPVRPFLQLSLNRDSVWPFCAVLELEDFAMILLICRSALFLISGPISVFEASGLAEVIGSGTLSLSWDFRCAGVCGVGGGFVAVSQSSSNQLIAAPVRYAASRFDVPAYVAAMTSPNKDKECKTNIVCEWLNKPSSKRTKLASLVFQT